MEEFHGKEKLIKSIPVYGASEETGKYVGLVNKGAKQNPQSKFTFSNYTLIKATNTSIKLLQVKIVEEDNKEVNYKLLYYMTHLQSLYIKQYEKYPNFGEAIHDAWKTFILGRNIPAITKVCNSAEDKLKAIKNAQDFQAYINLYNLAFQRASKLLINNGFFFVKIKSIPSKHYDL